MKRVFDIRDTKFWRIIESVEPACRNWHRGPGGVGEWSDLFKEKCLIKTSFFRRAKFCTQFDPLNDFLNHEFHIILKRKKLEICKHSSFFNYNK